MRIMCVECLKMLFGEDKLTEKIVIKDGGYKDSNGNLRCACGGLIKEIVTIEDFIRTTYKAGLSSDDIYETLKETDIYIPKVLFDKYISTIEANGNNND